MTLHFLFICNFLNYTERHYCYSHSLRLAPFHPFTFSTFPCSAMYCMSTYLFLSFSNKTSLILHWFATFVLLATNFQWHSPAFGAKSGDKVATNLFKPKWIRSQPSIIRYSRVLLLVRVELCSLTILLKTDFHAFILNLCPMILYTLLTASRFLASFQHYLPLILVSILSFRLCKRRHR